MTIRHPLSLPLQEYTTATSYVSSLTRYCGLSSPTDLCLDLGFRWNDFIRGNDTLFERIAEVGGVDPERLMRWAIRTERPGQFRILDHWCSKGLLQRTTLRVCPLCLGDDVARLGPHGVSRRYFWQLSAMRSCPKHHVAMVQLPTEKSSKNSYDFVEQVWKNKRLIDVDCIPLAHTDFERYVFNRLEGKQQNPFLDGLSLQVAVKLCETLGFVIRFGPSTKTSDSTQIELQQAAQDGFHALAAGIDGFINVLSDLTAPTANSTMRHKSDFGALYEWLRLSPFIDEVEPIRKIVRDYVFANYPVPEGFEVLGQVCEQRSFFTVEAACQTLGVERTRIGRYLIETRAADRNKTGQGFSLNRTISRSDIDHISAQMDGRVSLPKALEILQIKPSALQDLCELGLLQTKLDALDQVQKYDLNELKALIETVTSKIPQKCANVHRLLPLAEVAVRLRCKSAVIISLIAAGKLTNAAQETGSSGLAHILVELDEVRYALPVWKMPGVTKTEASAVLRVTYKTVSYLIAQGLLDSGRMRNPKSRQFIEGVCEGSTEAFLTQFDTLGLMARRFNRSAGPLASQLEANGICPIETPPRISWIFERQGLAKRLEKIGLRTPR